METLKKLIQTKQYAEAKSWIIDNRYRIEEIVDVLLKAISKLNGEFVFPTFDNATPKSGYKLVVDWKNAVTKEIKPDVFKQEYFGSWEYGKNEIKGIESSQIEIDDPFKDSKTGERLKDLFDVYMQKMSSSLGLPKNFIFGYQPDGKSLDELANIPIKKHTYNPIPEEDLKDLKETSFPIPEKPETWNYIEDGENGDIVGISCGYDVDKLLTNDVGRFKIDNPSNEECKIDYDKRDFEFKLINKIHEKTYKKHEVAISWYDINHHMFDIIIDGEKTYCGVVIIDFKNDDAIKRIVDVLFRYHVSYHIKMFKR